jgi:hypothetical protein
MATNEELRSFIKDGLARGVSRADLENVLGRAGWTAGDVQGALTSFAEVEFPIPVPRPLPYLSARDAFMYLLLFATLYISAFSLGRLVFQFINQAFPDAASPPFAAEFARQAIRWSVASLVVACPVFLGVSRLIGRELAAEPSKRASKVRRWLTYLTLFLAAGVLIGDVTTLVYNVLGGELTARFVLKVLTIGSIAGSVFWFYLSDLRTDEQEMRS